MYRFKLLYFVIFIISLYRINAQISDKRLCVDEECKVPISLARTLLKYSSPDSRILSFAPNVDVTIYSKSAGSREDLWGGEINGKRGYVPKRMVRETKILEKPTLLVDTEFNNETETQQVPSQVAPNKVQEPYEVVDGTTIYLSPQDDIIPSSTESPIQSTALPTEAETNKFTTRNILSSEPLTDQKETVKDEGPPDPPKDQESIADKKDEVDEDSAEIDIDTEDDDDEQEHKENVNSTESVTEQAETESQKQDTTPEVKSDTGSEEKLKEPVSDTTGEKSEAKLETENIPAAITESGNEPIKKEPNNESESQKEPVLDITGSESQKSIEDTEKLLKQNPEMTTIIPEIEVPQPFDDIFVEVTPIPLEETKIEGISSVPPPLGIFVNPNAESLNEEKPDITNVPIEEKPVVINAQKEEVPIEKKPEVNVQKEEMPIEEKPEVINIQKEEEKPEVINVQKEEVPIEEKPKVNVQKEEMPIEEKPEVINNQIEEEKPEVINVQKEEVPIEEKPKVNVQKEEMPIEEKPEVINIQKEEEKPEVINVQKEEVPIEESPEATNIKKEEIPIEEPEVINIQKKEETPVVPEVKNEEILRDTVEDIKSIESNTEASSQDVDDLPKEAEDILNNEENESGSFFTGMLSFIGLGSSSEVEKEDLAASQRDDIFSKVAEETFCDAASCPTKEMDDGSAEGGGIMDLFAFNSNVFLYLVTTAISVIIFLFGYIAFDKSKREGPLIAKINNLEKELLILIKENQILQEKLISDSGYETNDRVSSEVVENLKQDLFEVTRIKSALEEQVQSLEKELENSTEVGMELNRMLTEILSSESGSDVIKANVENLQRQLVEQQATINSVNETLAITNTENHELRLELELKNKKVLDLQAELDKLLLNILKIEEEKETQQTTLENEIVTYRKKYEEVNNKLKVKEQDHNLDLIQLRKQLDQTERKLELKTKEQDQLKETMKQLKALKNNDESTLRELLEVGNIKAELQVLKSENQKLSEKLQQEQDLKLSFEKNAQTAEEELRGLKEKYDEADKLRVETQTKLEVLSNYFKDREAQWQKEISKHEQLWAEKEGEASSTTERMKFMQEQLQNYKSQTESLKQEIMSQEIELKSQISVLEKKVHENWVSARQAERKLEDAKQEAAQLRHRLTLRERQDQHRLQSPIEQNGDIPESPASPPLLYGTRDHITKSPPLTGLPPFLPPPPPGVPFMPPPLHGVPPFIPPPPNMFPGDHRPPPLGRMSSPPLNSRYSPSSRGYSPYDRNSSSPSDSEYGTSPPHRRGYSPFHDRRDYKRPPPGRSNGRSLTKGGSSGSNESLEKNNRQQSKV